jgi:hypothetical protein
LHLNKPSRISGIKTHKVNKLREEDEKSGEQVEKGKKFSIKLKRMLTKKIGVTWNPVFRIQSCKFLGFPDPNP